MAWYDSAVFYHMYPLGLCGCAHENMGEAENHFDKLDQWAKHAHEIGCTAIYIGPLFESGSHGYDTIDYRMVDRRLGTNEAFREFVKKCHDMQMHVIVDGVFNHTGRDFFAMKDIREKRERSPYCGWYCNINFGENNEYNDGFSYDNWGGYNLLAKLNLQNPEVKQYHFDTVRFWVQEFDIDGIRLDAADVLDFQFMRELRGVANTVKPEFWLMGEVIHGDYSRWANADTLHSVTNYELHKGLYSGHNDHNYFEIAHTIQRLQGLVGDTRLYTFTDNHDVARLASKLQNKEHLYPVTMLLYTVPGIPSIYYGSEFGIEGQKERGSDWNLRPNLELSQFDVHAELPQLVTKLGKLKQKFPELTYGTYQQLMLTNRQFVFARVLDGKAVVVLLNNDDAPAHIEVNLPVDADHAWNLLSMEEKSEEEKREEEAQWQKEAQERFGQLQGALQEKSGQLLGAAGEIVAKAGEIRELVASLTAEQNTAQVLQQAMLALHESMENMQRTTQEFEKTTGQKLQKETPVTEAMCKQFEIRDGRLIVDVPANRGVLTYLCKQ